MSTSSGCADQAVCLLLARSLMSANLLVCPVVQLDLRHLLLKGPTGQTDAADTQEERPTPVFPIRWEEPETCPADATGNAFQSPQRQPDYFYMGTSPGRHVTETPGPQRPTVGSPELPATEPVRPPGLPHGSGAGRTAPSRPAPASPDMLQDTWASQIDVNEEYTYSELELNIISQAIALSADYFHRTFRPFDLSGVFHDLVLLRSSDGVQNSHVAIRTFIINVFKKLSLDQKINILFSSRKAEESMLHLHKLQRAWDNLVT